MQIAVRARCETQDAAVHRRYASRHWHHDHRHGHRRRPQHLTCSPIFDTETDLDAALAALTQADPRFAALIGASRPAAAAAAARRICRARRDRGVATAFDRERRRDLGTARRGVRSVRAGGHHRARAGAAGAARPVGAENPGAQGNRPRGRRAASSRSQRSANIAADDAHAALTAVHGIGPWTADIYLLSCLGHADAWPAGDLALQEAARLAFGLRARPTAKEMVAARRTVAAVARRGGARAVDLLSRRQRPRRRAGRRPKPRRRNGTKQ